MVDQITRKILADKWHRHTNGLYYPGAGGLHPYGYDIAILAQDFLKALHRICGQYFESRKAGEPNYEQLFDLAERIELECVGDSHDVSIAAFIEKLRSETMALWKPLKDGPYFEKNEDSKLASLAEQSQVFIQSAVRSLLQVENAPSGLDALVGLCKSDEIEGVDIVTLNHDVLLETVLRDGGVGFQDGFSFRENNVRYFDNASFEENSRITLVKPHGSLNWYRIRRNTDHGAEDRFGIPDPGIDPWYVRDKNGRYLDVLIGSDPLFLTGTQKVPKYLTGLHGMQVAWFRRFLGKTQHVVCCGYGWRDAGMNQLLLEWLHSSLNNRLYLLHKNAVSELFHRPYSFWMHRHEKLQKFGRLRIVDKWLCDLTSEDLLEIIRR